MYVHRIRYVHLHLYDCVRSVGERFKELAKGGGVRGTADCDSVCRLRVMVVMAEVVGLTPCEVAASLFVC